MGCLSGLKPTVAFSPATSIHLIWPAAPPAGLSKRVPKPARASAREPASSFEPVPCASFQLESL